MKIINKAPLWTLLLLIAFSNTTEIIYSTALPSLTQTLNIQAATMQTTASVYFIGFAIGIFSLGRLSDIIGRRPVVLTGLILYTSATIISLLFTQFEVILVLRFIQAFGASIGSVVGQSIARDSYSGKELSYIYATLSIGSAIIPAIGSLISGYILEYCGWKYLLILLSSFSSFLLLVYCYYLPETNNYLDKNNRNKYLTIIKVVLRDKILLLYAFIVGAFNGIIFGFMIEAPFLFINLIDISPSIYGKLLFVLNTAYVFASVFSRYLVKKHVSTKKIIMIGLVSSIFGAIILVAAAYLTANEYIQLNKKIVATLILLPMMFQLVGRSVLMPIALRYALEDYHKVTGTAGSIFGTIYYLLVAFISFLVSRLHSGNDFIKFALLLLILVILSSASWYYIHRSIPQKKKYEFQ